ncbi:BglG family transcription antiterminator [Lacticaseibacillus daqingensis]|uniref:BglG family transcription antiterminator n=1 Tax=Lacticaseibacillus daqingensis TaxID=2486014 RepID=UPI000F7B8780|nr:PRD domain-containing protein [Lacticaseibacillus daqingensis]
MERTAFIVKQLIQADDYLSTELIARRLRVSSKTVRSDLEELEGELAEYGMRILRKPGKGVRIEGQPDAKRRLLRKIDHYGNSETTDLLSRQIDLVLRVIGRSAPVYIKDIAVDFFVSRATVNRDIALLNREFLSDFGLSLENGADGLTVIGEETSKRSAMTRLITMKCDAKLQSMAVEDDEFIVYLQQLIGIDITSLIRLLNRVERDFRSQMTIAAQRNFLIHVAVAITRIRNRKTVPTAPNLDQQIDAHTDEMQQLKRAVSEVERFYSVNFDRQELYLLLLHVISSENLEVGEQTGIPTDFEIQVKALIQRVSKEAGRDFTHDDELEKSLILHLRIALKRVEFGMRIENPFLAYVIEHNFDLFVAVKNNIKTVFASGVVPDAEIAYITIHFMASTERIQKKPRVMVLCASGLGVSQLLLERIKRYFPNYDVKGVIRLDDLQTLTPKDVDLIISTVEIKTRTEIAFVVIDPMEDLGDIKNEVYQDTVRVEGTRAPFEFRADGVLQLDDFATKEELLDRVSDWLIARDCATPDYKKALLDREAIGSTYIGKGIALIHGRYNSAQGRPSLNVVRLGHHILWDRKNEVDLLFNFIPTESSRQDFALLFRRMGRTIDNGTFWKQIKQVEPQKMVDLLNKEFGL